jgi:protein-disulfide isomerase
MFARDTFARIRSDYITPGRLLFAFRNFPLDGHPFARGAAAAAACAGRQGQFWQMHDAFFKDQQHLDDASVRMQAGSLGLNLSQFDDCLSGQAQDRIKADLAIAKSLGLEGTPTVFAGKLLPGLKVRVVARLAGARQWSAYEAVLDRITK